jgi:hypothetical protein
MEHPATVSASVETPAMMMFLMSFSSDRYSYLPNRSMPRTVPIYRGALIGPRVFDVSTSKKRRG